MDENPLDAFFDEMDDETLEALAEEFGLQPEISFAQIAHAEVIAEVASSAPFAGGLLSLSPHEPAMIHSIDSSELLSQVKNALLRVYPADLDVFYVTMFESENEEVEPIKLADLDAEEPDDERVLFLPAIDVLDNGRTIQSLQQIIARLRAPGGCPWDREQTHQSLTRYMIEEAYEAVQAIETAGPSQLAEELGDVLLQILLHAQIAEENGAFTLEDIFEILAAKMIRRHPHVFGDRSVESAGEVVTAWDQIKQQERAHETDDAESSIFGSIPSALPALSRVQTMLRRAESHGMDTQEISNQVAASLRESGDADEARIAEQLASIAREARTNGVDAEGALRRWSERFATIANELAPKSE